MPTDSEELDALLSQLRPDQLQAVKEAVGTEVETPPEHVRRVAPNNMGCECEVQMVCLLCGTKKVQKLKSSSSLPSMMHLKSCGSCKEVLAVKEKEELVLLLIEVSEGEYGKIRRETK